VASDGAVADARMSFGRRPADDELLLDACGEELRDVECDLEVMVVD